MLYHHHRRRRRCRRRCHHRTRKSPPPKKKQETIQLQIAREEIWNANNGNPKHRRQHSRNLPG